MNGLQLWKFEMCDNTFENDDLKRDLNTLTISILCEEVTEDDK